MNDQLLHSDILELYHDRFSEIPLVVMDSSGIITYANKAFNRRLGCDETPIGHSISYCMNLDLSMKDPIYDDEQKHISVDLVTTSFERKGERITLRGHLLFDGTQYVAIFDIFKQHYEQVLEQVTRLNLEMSSITRDYSKQYEVKDKQARENRELAMKDQLTGLGNRRKFFEDLEQALSGKSEPPVERGFGIIMFDVDNFKQVNDRLGHDVGDEVLKSLSQTVSELIRDDDIPARYGGEEFIILAHCSELGNLKAMAEKIRATVASTVIPSLGRAVTASFGITMKQASDTQLTLIKRADEALYEAKGLGKNCVVGK
jgi:diguanylate cyclase (GGDEF)-like protein